MVITRIILLVTFAFVVHAIRDDETRITIGDGLTTGDMIEWFGRVSHMRTQSLLVFRDSRNTLVFKIYIQGHRYRLKIEIGDTIRYACLGSDYIYPNKQFRAMVYVSPKSLILYFYPDRKIILNFPFRPNVDPSPLVFAGLYGRSIEMLTNRFQLVDENRINHNFVADDCGRTVVGYSVDVSALCDRLKTDHKIAGGITALPKQQPWQASIRFSSSYISNGKRRHYCGAILIGSCWLLTAAHCFKSSLPESLNKYVIRVGDFYSEDDSPHSALTHLENSRDITIERIIKHPSFKDDPRPINDIALIKLSECVSFNDFVQPACLPSFSNQFRDGHAECSVTGWGASEFREALDDYPKCLQIARVTVRNLSQCIENYIDHAFDSSTMMCASNPNVDTCQGDSGGPLMCTNSVNNQDRHVLWGITSWGVGCAKENRPGIYTRVSSFKRWIYLNTEWLDHNITNVELQRNTCDV